MTCVPFQFIASARKFLAPIGAAALALGLAAPAIYADDSNQTQQAATERVFRIGFNWWKPGKIYDEAVQGITDGLEMEGIRYEAVTLQADLNADRARSNLQQMDAMGLDLIYSLASQGTQIAKTLNLRTPVVATVVNHPASLGVEGNDTSRGTRLAGTSYYVDAKKQLDLYLELFPNVKRIGMVFDRNNPAGSLAEEPFMRTACESRGLEFQSIGIADKAELGDATKRLADLSVDLIVVPTNTLIYENLGTVLDVANQRKIPVVAMNKQGVENGALAALFADTYDLGRQAATIARRILVDGVDPAKIGFEYIATPQVIINLKSAGALAFTFPPRVLGEATMVIQ